MPPGRRPFPMYTRVELERWYREVACPTCGAARYAACRDMRTPHTYRVIPLAHEARQHERVRKAMNPTFNFDELVREVRRMTDPNANQWVTLKNARMKITPLDEESPKMEREEVIRQRIRELEDELALRTRYGRDVYDDGTVLAWIKTYPSRSDAQFHYAAIKSDDGWYMTGKITQSRTWENLIAEWTTADVVEVVKVLRVGSVIGTPAPQTDLEKSVAASTPPPAKEAGE